MATTWISSDIVVCFADLLNERFDVREFVCVVKSRVEMLIFRVGIEL